MKKEYKSPLVNSPAERSEVLTERMQSVPRALFKGPIAIVAVLAIAAIASASTFLTS